MLLVVEGGADDIVSAFRKECTSEAGCRPHVLSLTPDGGVLQVRLDAVEFTVPRDPTEHIVFDPRTSLDEALRRAALRISNVVLALPEPRWQLAPGAASAGYRYLVFTPRAPAPAGLQLKALASDDTVELAPGGRRSVVDATRRELRLAQRGPRRLPRAPEGPRPTAVAAGPGHMAYKLHVGARMERPNTVAQLGYRVDVGTAKAFEALRQQLNDLRQRYDDGKTVLPERGAQPQPDPPARLGDAIVEPVIRRRFSPFGALAHDYYSLARQIAEHDGRARDTVNGTLRAIEACLTSSPDNTTWLQPYLDCEF